MGSTSSSLGSVSQLRDGLAVLLGKSGTVKIEGKEVKLHDVLVVLDKLTSSAKEAAQAKAAYRRAVAVQRAVATDTGPMLLALRTQLLGSYTAEQLAVCGIAPRKAKRRLSSAERTAITAKARATRIAHGRVSAKRAREEAALAEVVAAYGPHGSAPTSPAHAAPSAASATPSPAPAPASDATH